MVEHSESRPSAGTIRHVHDIVQTNTELRTATHMVSFRLIVSDSVATSRHTLDLGSLTTKCVVQKDSYIIVVFLTHWHAVTLQWLDTFVVRLPEGTKYILGI